jgi:hypothetical protein
MIDAAAAILSSFSAALADVVARTTIGERADA